MKIESLEKLGTPEAVELFISTSKALIKDDIEETSRELNRVELDGKNYNLKITVSAIEVD